MCQDCGDGDTLRYDILKVIGYDGPHGEPVKVDLSGVTVECQSCGQQYCIST